MSMFPVFVPKLLSRDEYFVSGRRSCKGCGKALSVRMISKMMGKEYISAGTGVGTSSIPQYNQSGTGLAWDEITSGDLTATYVEHLLAGAKDAGSTTCIRKAVVGIDRRVFTRDFLALSEMFARERNVLYICYDSEMYMHELLKRSAPSLQGHGKDRSPTRDEMRAFIRNKNMPAQVAEHSLSYTATACPSFPLDLMEKIKKALRRPGTALVSVLTPCPTAWLFKPELTAQLGYLAVTSGFYPLYEEEGGSPRITKRISHPKPLAEYFKAQQRYLAFPPAWLALLQEAVSEEHERLMAQTDARTA